MATVSVDELLRYPDEWKLVPLHGINDRGECCCSRGADCPSPGKHPTHKDWASIASNDEDQIIDWFDGRSDRNVGLLLGPESRVIDIEFDDERGRELADKLLSDVITPTYTSGRSVHRLFLWDEELPDIQKRVINGLEIRLGGGGKSTQSVVPPSLHHSGQPYVWNAGLSPEEVEIVTVPKTIKAMLYNQEDLTDPTSTRSVDAQKIYDQAFIGEGERNKVMLSWACQQAKRAKDINLEIEQETLWLAMVGINQTKVKPPLDERELKTIHQQAINYTQRDDAETTVEGVTYTQHGLERREDQWFPGDWQLTVVMSDPPEYKLNVPAWKELTPDGTGDVVMTAEHFVDANKMALAVLKATREIYLCDQPRRWPGIWNGVAASKSSGGRIGLCKRLLDARQVVDPPAMRKRSVVVAEWFAERLSNASKLLDGQKDPDDSAIPTKMNDGSIWIRWEKLWRDGMLSGEIEQGEREQLAGRLGLGKRESRIHRTAHGQRLRFMVLSESHLKRLRELTDIE